MIISRAPFRISFFGGGTDYPEWYKENGGKFLSLAIDKYAYLTIRVKSSLIEKRFRVAWRLSEDVPKVSMIKHPIVRESLLEMNFDKGVDISYIGDLPGGTGMGSSSAFTVALNHGLLAVLDKNPTPYELAEISYKIERNKLDEVIGIQDQIASAFGGFNYVTIQKDGKYNLQEVLLDREDLENFLNRIILVYTGISRRASSVAEQQIEDIKKKKDILDEMQDMVTEGYNYLISGNLDDFGSLLGKSWKLKRSISNVISNIHIDELYERGVKNGALGGKLLGAGSGGFLMFFCKDGQRKNVEKSFDKEMLVPFSISESGSKIIYNE
tara:strand:- start:496 stop:1473 length:978 start_codon:yes stop_codon:yes gene_type:complete